MNVNLIEKGSREFQKVLEAVTRELISVRDSPKGAFITTPLTYPGGAAVVVQVSESGKDFFVSDFGTGLEEAEAMGANTQTFARYAHAIADATGIRFDNHSFFVIEATRAQLAGAIVAVANASQAAVVHTAFRMTDKIEQTDILLFSRLATIFKGRNAQVIENPHITGRSTTVWPVDALVRSGNKQSVFEGVRNHRLSVAYASMKFNDIALNDNAPQCFAVVRNKAAFGTFLNVLSQSGANVIEDSISDLKIIELAEAA